MAKVIITIQDNHGETNIVMESDPVFNQTGDDAKPNTPAQELALALLEIIADASKEEGLLKRAVAIQNDGTEVKL